MAGALAVGSAALLLAAAFAPWTVSGTVERNGWATATSALRIEVVDGPARLLTIAWLFVPPLLALAALAASLGRVRLAWVVAGAVGALGVVVAAAVRTAPLASTAAPLVAGLAGGALVLCALGMLLALPTPAPGASGPHHPDEVDA